MLNIKTKEEFDNIIETIKSNLSFYNSHLCDIKYTLFSASGSTINIKYDISHIPHLLGINMDYLRMLNCYSSKSSHDLLQEFIRDSYSAYRKSTNPGSIFSDYVLEKNTIFAKNLKINLENIVALVEYRKERVYGISEVEKPCDCYIIQKTPRKEAYIILGLAKSDNSYIPQTSQIIDLSIDNDRENLKNILYKQNITFCSGLRYQNGYNKPVNCSLYPNVKAEIMLILKKLAEEFECEISVASDYSYLLKHLGEVKSNNKFQKENLRVISEKIAAGKVVDIELFEELDNELIELINSYNNSLTRDKTENSMLYSDLSQAYIQLKKQIELLTKENTELKMDSIEKDRQIEILQQENEELIQMKQKIYAIVK